MPVMEDVSSARTALPYEETLHGSWRILGSITKPPPAPSRRGLRTVPAPRVTAITRVAAQAATTRLAGLLRTLYRKAHSECSWIGAAARMDGTPPALQAPASPSDHKRDEYRRVDGMAITGIARGAGKISALSQAISASASSVMIHQALVRRSPSPGSQR